MAELCEFIEYDGHVGSPIVLQNGHKRPKKHMYWGKVVCSTASIGLAAKNEIKQRLEINFRCS